MCNACDTEVPRGTAWDTVGRLGIQMDTAEQDYRLPWGTVGLNRTPRATVSSVEHLGVPRAVVGHRRTMWGAVGQRGTAMDTLGHRG